MAIYSTANSTDMTDISTIFYFINNNLSGGVFMPMLMFTLWIIAFIGSLVQGRQAYRSWIFANFICAILSIILGFLGMISPSYIYFFIILLGFGLVWAMLAKRRTF